MPRRTGSGTAVLRNGRRRVLEHGALAGRVYRHPATAGFAGTRRPHDWPGQRSEEHTSELQSLMRISYAVFCLKKKKTTTKKYDVLSRSKNHTRLKHKHETQNHQQYYE